MYGQILIPLLSVQEEIKYSKINKYSSGALCEQPKLRNISEKKRNHLTC